MCVYVGSVDKVRTIQLLRTSDTPGEVHYLCRFVYRPAFE